MSGTESWGVIPQNFNNIPDTSWNDSTVSRPQVENWERTGNWGADRPSAPAPSENNLSVKKTLQDSWGQNKSENSWNSRNDTVQVDHSTWQQRKEQPAISTSEYNVKRENEEEKLDSLAMQVGIQQSFETLRNDDRHLVLDEDDYDPNYENFSNLSKPQLGKSSATPFEEEIPFNSDEYNAKSRIEPFITSPNSTFQGLPKKEFRNIEVQTDPIDISRIIASKEKLLSCTISSPMKKEYQQMGQEPSSSATNNVPEKRYPPHQVSLLDVDPEEWNTKVNRKTSSSDREGKSDTSSRGEVTQWPKPNSDSWDNKPISVQNDSWNRTPTRNDNRGTVPVTPDSWDARNDNRRPIPQQVPVTPDSWDAPPQTSASQTSASQTSTRDDNRGPIPQQIPVTPDSWNAPPQTSTSQTSASQTSTRNDNRGPIPQQVPVTPDSWDAPPQTSTSQTSTSQTSTRNDNRGPIPQQIPVTPDSWDARNDNRGSIPQQVPVTPDSWDAPPQTSASQISTSQTSTRNDNRGPVPQQIPVTPDSWDAQNDNRGPIPQQIPVTPDSWNAPPQTSASQTSTQTSTRNDNRGPIPQQVPVTPDSWDARNDNRGPIPQQIPVTPDSWDASPQPPANNVNRDPVPQSIPRNDNRGTVPQISVEPDSWDSTPQTPAKNNQGSDFQPKHSWGTVPQPIQNNSWNQQQSRPNDTMPQEGQSENWKTTSIQQGSQNSQTRELSNTNNQWGSTADPTNDWTKKAEMFARELGESSESKVWEQTSNAGQKAEDSYGTGASDSYYDNSSSNNRCRNCGQEGHYARDCPDKKQSYSGGKSCHNCGKEGHFARDCTEGNSKGGYGGGGGRSCHKCGKEGHYARECTEENSKGGYGGGGGRSCHKCGKEGHFARDCREDAYETTGEDSSFGSRNTCFKCKRPGHRASECTEEPGEFNNSGLSRPLTKISPFSNPEQPNITPQEAWKKLLDADNEEDAEDFSEALETYAKTAPEETFVSIEKKLREANCKGRIIALERSEIPLTKLLVDLQGNTNKKYVARPIIGLPSRLARTSGNRANDDEENLQWLANAGFMVDDYSPICFNCRQKGHLSKDCPEPKREIEKPSYLTCQNCNSPDHLTKYCKEERRDYYVEARDRKVAGGYKGGSMEYEDKAASGYSGEDNHRSYRGYNGSNPESRRGRKCNRCGEEGHMQRDCPNSSGGNYDRGNYNSNSGWQRDSSSRNNDKNASWSTQDRGGDTTWNKPRNENTSVPALSPRENSWNNPSGGDSSRGDYNHNAQYRSENDTYGNNSRNSSLPTQNKSRDTSQQRDDQPALIPKVESDSWDAAPKTANTAGGNEWGFKTAEDFGWEKSSENKALASGDYENRRGHGNEQRERTPTHDDYENKRGRGGDQRERTSAYNDYENRRSRNDQRERSSTYNDYENRRGRSNDQRAAYDDYDNRRSRGNENQRERSSAYDDRRNRGNDQRERSTAYEDYDNRRNRGNDQRERPSVHDDYDNRRSRGNDRNNNRFTNSNRMQSNDTDNKNPGLVDRSWW